MLLEDFSALRIEGRIGQGGMGTVFRARAPDGRLVAVKVLPPEREATRRRRTRFLLEVSCMARLDHPRIVRVLGTGEVRGRPWLAMDYVDAPDLGAWILHRRRNGVGGLPLGAALPIFRELANAFSALRLAGIVHRDVKPANLLLRGDGTPVLVDFGLARELVDPEQITRTGALVGTLDFLAPEQIAANRTGPEVDYYALGLSLWVALVGALPYPTLSPAMRAMKRAERDLPAPSRARPDVPPELDALVAELTARDPARRLVDPGELAVRLELLRLGLGEEAAQPALGELEAVAEESAAEA